MSKNNGVSTMQTQWYLCEIERYPDCEGEELKKTNNLYAKYSNFFSEDIQKKQYGDNNDDINSWLVWLPIIPRIGDTLQFRGWQVQVSNVILRTDYTSERGIKEGVFISARIWIHDDVVPSLTDTNFSIEALNNEAVHKWEDFARRGYDLQYYAWELKHKFYELKSRNQEETFNYRWHTRIRPIAGDIVAITNNRWQVVSVELASANASVDGWLTLEEIA